MKKILLSVLLVTFLLGGLYPPLFAKAQTPPDQELLQATLKLLQSNIDLLSAALTSVKTQVTTRTTIGDVQSSGGIPIEPVDPESSYPYEIPANDVELWKAVYNVQKSNPDFNEVIPADFSETMGAKAAYNLAAMASQLGGGGGKYKTLQDIINALRAAWQKSGKDLQNTILDIIKDLGGGSDQTSLAIGLQKLIDMIIGQFDLDHSGSLSESELRNFLTSIGVVNEPGWTGIAYLDRLIQKIKELRPNPFQDGRLTPQELYAVFAKLILPPNTIPPQPPIPNCHLGNIALGPGSSGPEVRDLQSFLNSVGYALPITGVYGELTKSAVMKFQADSGIPPTGVFGALSRTAVDRAIVRDYTSGQSCTTAF